MMYKKELDTLLRTHIPRASLLYGESAFLIDAYTKQILAGTALEPVVIAYSDYHLRACLDILEQSSLFGDAQCVVLKLEKKPSEKDIKALIQALERNEDHCLILAFYKADSRTPAQYRQDFKFLAKTFKSSKIHALHANNPRSLDSKKSGVVDVWFFPPTPSEALMLLRLEANALGIAITNPLLESLLEMQHYDIAIACNELKKLAGLDKPITKQDLDFLCYGLGSVDMEELLHALFLKKGDKGSDVLQVFEQMIEAGLSSEMTLVSELEGYFYKLFLFAAYMRLYGKPDSEQILGYKMPYQESNRLTDRAMRIKEQRFSEIFSLLGFWRNGILQGNKSISLRCLIKLQALAR